MSADITYKVIVGGDGGVGKTTLLRRYVEGFFVENTQMTIGVQIHKKTLEANNHLTCDLQLWDLGGQHRFRPFQDSFVRGSRGALLVFDLTRRLTIKKIDHWVDLIRKYDSDIPILLVGAKYDLMEKISIAKEEIEELVDEHGLSDYFPTSSKTGLNVELTFRTLTNYLLQKHNIYKNIELKSRE
ncbi:MAG: Rab family GTPase [Promethearchaeia archaeon]